MSAKKKSDFIVNITEQGFEKLCFILLATMTVLLPLSLVPYYLFKNRVDFVDEFGIPVYLSEKLIFFHGSAMTLVASFALLIVVIALVKKYLSMKDNAVLISATVFSCFAVVSTLFSANRSLSLNGNFGRFEGIITILGYISIFVVAMFVARRKYIKSFFDIFIAATSLQAVIGILQHFEVAPNFFKSYYSVVRNGYLPLYAADGFTGSPFILVSLIAIALAISLVGCAMDKSTLRRVLYGVASVVFVLSALFTYTLTGLIAICAVVVIFLVYLVVTFIKVKQIKTVAIGLLVVFVNIFVVAITLISQGVKLHDATIITEDGFYRLYISGIINPTDENNIHLTLWKNSLSVIKANPILGSGAETYAMAQGGENFLAEINATDRPYNEFLYIAAVLGIPALLAYISLVALSIKRGISKLCVAGDEKYDWVKFATLFAVIAYLVQAFFNNSNILSTPIFFALLGILASKKAES